MSDYIRTLVQSRNIPRPADQDEMRWFSNEGAGIPAYAADDNSVVFNPNHQVPKTAGGYDSLATNEGARIEMRKNGDFFGFPLEQHQQDFFAKHSPDHYAKDSQAARQTTVARILANDQSLAPYTARQQAAAAGSAGRMIASDEPKFQKWYADWSSRTGLSPNPDDPEHKYDYRSAYRDGAIPTLDQSDGYFHWPSKYKNNDHPNRFIDGVDTKYRRPQ